MNITRTLILYVNHTGEDAPDTMDEGFARRLENAVLDALQFEQPPFNSYFKVDWEFEDEG